MKRPALLALSLVLATPAAAQGINFGNDSSDYANDGICDDRRFYGSGMAITLDWEDLARDATDCEELYNAGKVKLWDFSAAVAATQCTSVDFGNDDGDYPHDGECDDPRFEGMAVDGIVLEEAIGTDASDCRAACEFGLLGLRDYDVVKPDSGRKSSRP